MFMLLGDEKLSSSVTLPLAERMISNMAKEKKIKQEQETRLYLMVLELQVRSKAGSKLVQRSTILYQFCTVPSHLRLKADQALLFWFF